ncbi:alpha/beta hydrolase [Sediminicoccus sp. KRV36]|uniref:alpha/beta fold hydrolase n=1 Tax=Sediminicoccus sp. KRV36 TaxID=3133721 RepID=UPI00200FAC8B|nr:alpha/beta hydrolase [Sediminicoccus rosea]UPY36528.1 alpha/beta hydrolase [Sediminicoccus rosea]
MTPAPNPLWPTLLLHGIGGRAALWADSIAALAPRPVIAMDMPGYDGTRPALASFAALADAAVALLDARGIGSADVVGHSLGGMLALELALRHPARVRRLVIVASSPAFGSRDPAFREAFLAARQKPLDEGLGMAGVARALVPGMLGPAASAQAAPAAIAAMGSVDEAAYRITLATLTSFDRRADLPRVAQPALLIAGEADATAPPRGMSRMAEAMPDARLVVIPGVGHLLPLEAPEAFHAALLAFLA